MHRAIVLFVFLQAVFLHPTAVSAAFEHHHVRRSAGHHHHPAARRAVDHPRSGLSIPLQRRRPSPQSSLQRRDVSDKPVYGTLDTSVLGFVEHDLQALANKYQSTLRTLERKFGTDEVAQTAQGAGTVDGGVEVQHLSESQVEVHKDDGHPQIIVDGEPVETNSTVLAATANSITKRLASKKKAAAVAAAKRRAAVAASKKRSAAAAAAKRKKAAAAAAAAKKSKARAAASSKAAKLAASKASVASKKAASKSKTAIKTTPTAVVTSSDPVPTKSASASAPLEPFTGGTAWAGTVDVGTPPQAVMIDFDTGSSDVWLASTGCTSDICTEKVRYDAAKSSSYTSVPSKSFAITYGDGSKTAGPVGKETFEVAGLEVTGQMFSPVTSMSGSLAELAITGMIGMAYPALSAMSAPPLFYSMVSQNVVSSPQFSFKLSLTSGKSSLFLGGADPSLYVSGSRKWYDVNPKLWFWNITGTAYVSGATTGAGSFGAIIDTGTSFIVAPPAKAQAFYDSIPGAVSVGSGGFWIVPCNAMPTLSFQFGDGQKYVVDYNLGQANSYYCWSAVMGLDVGVGSNTWLLGDTFLSTVYTTFDQGQNRVGFAKLA